MELLDIYVDEKLTKKLGSGAVINLGTCVEGDRKTKMLYIPNPSEDAVLRDIEVVFKDGEEILKDEDLVKHGVRVYKPDIILQETTGTINLVWEPPMNYNKALKLRIEINSKKAYFTWG